jgi:hypothetical protein
MSHTASHRKHDILHSHRRDRLNISLADVSININIPLANINERESSAWTLHVEFIHTNQINDLPITK